METIYYIGGGTCCGKSTIAELLSEKYGFPYYKLDDDLWRFTELVAANGNSYAAATLAGSLEDMWMRDPVEMCADELAFYADMFPFAREALAAHTGDRPLITEGAGWLPSLMHTAGIPKNRYFCMAPTRAFQLEKYAQRPWIKNFIEDTSDPEQAFSNWMERDVLFSEQVMTDAVKRGYATLLVDGSSSIEETMRMVEQAFGLR